MLLESCTFLEGDFGGKKEDVVLEDSKDDEGSNDKDDDESGASSDSGGLAAPNSTNSHDSLLFKQHEVQNNNQWANWATTTMGCPPTSKPPSLRGNVLATNDKSLAGSY